MSDKPHAAAIVYSKSKKRGCPTCAGNDPKSCLRCNGKTRMCDWYAAKIGFYHRNAPAAPGEEVSDE